MGVSEADLNGTGDPSDTGLVCLAIFMSHVEALVVASMLRGHGIHADLGAEGHASIERISLALGGFRLSVFRADYQLASGLLREAGTCESHVVSTGPRKAFFRFALAWLGACGLVYVATAVLDGTRPNLSWLIGPFQLVTPLNPQGRADYFLAPILN